MSIRNARPNRSPFDYGKAADGVSLKKNSSDLHDGSIEDTDGNRARLRRGGEKEIVMAKVVMAKYVVSVVLVIVLLGVGIYLSRRM